MKLITSFLLGCLVLLSSGCRTESADPMVKQITPHLAKLRDTPTQQQVLQVIGECENLREAYGTEAVADALKQIAQHNPELQDQALSILSRYVSVEEHSDFVIALKMKK